MKTQLISFGDALNELWGFVQKNFKPLVIYALGPQFIYSLVILILLVPLGLNAKDLNNTNTFTNFGALFSGIFILGIIGWLVGIFISLLQVIVIIELKNGRSVTFDFLLKQTQKLVLNYALLSLLVGLAVLAGFLLLIIPGIIFGVWFFASMFFLIEEGKTGVSAMKESKRLVEGYTWDVFWRFFLGFLIVALLSMLVSIPFNRAESLQTPYYMTSGLLQGIFNGCISVASAIFSYIVYRSLKAIKAS